MAFEEVKKMAGRPPFAAVRINPDGRQGGWVYFTREMAEQMNRDIGGDVRGLVWRIDNNNKKVLVSPSTKREGQWVRGRISGKPIRLLEQVRSCGFLFPKSFENPRFNKKLGGYVLSFNK